MMIVAVEAVLVLILTKTHNKNKWSRSALPIQRQYIVYSSVRLKLLFVMSIFLTKKHGEQATTASSRSPRVSAHTARQKSVTPFFCQQKQVSPMRKRVDQSPLQGALTIAIKKLASQNRQRELVQPHIDTSSCEKRLDWSEFQVLMQKGCQVDRSVIQNLKNILQQFMQSIYCQAEREIYAKFNSQMKRLIIKYRETERVLKKIQQKLITHADIFEVEAKLNIKDQYYTKRIVELQQTINLLNRKIELETQQKQSILHEMIKVGRENQKLKSNNERYENILLRQLEEAERMYVPSANRTLKQEYSNMSQRVSFTNLLANQHYIYSQPQERLDTSSIVLSNSNSLNVNRLEPSRSPVSKKGKNPRSNLQNKQKPLDLDHSFQLIKRRKA